MLSFLNALSERVLFCVDSCFLKFLKCFVFLHCFLKVFSDGVSERVSKVFLFSSTGSNGLNAFSALCLRLLVMFISAQVF